MINMTIVKLSDEERWGHYETYCENGLFVQWKKVLKGYCEKQYTFIDAESLWSHSNMVLEKLKYTKHDRGEMALFLIDEMERANQNNYQVESVAAIVFTRLANAAHQGYTHEVHPNDEICAPIYHHYGQKSFFWYLICNLHKYEMDCLGRPVVLTPDDPMTDNVSMAELTKTRQEDIERKLQVVLDRTGCIQLLLESEWDNWKGLWLEILKNDELFMLIDKVKPLGNIWGINMKMVLNVLGLFRNTHCLYVTVNSLNDSFNFGDKRKYISECKAPKSSYCGLSQEQIMTIEVMIGNL